jgi:hypothetical protein
MVGELMGAAISHCLSGEFLSLHTISKMAARQPGMAALQDILVSGPRFSLIILPQATTPARCHVSSSVQCLLVDCAVWPGHRIQRATASRLRSRWVWRVHSTGERWRPACIIRAYNRSDEAMRVRDSSSSQARAVLKTLCLTDRPGHVSGPRPPSIFTHWRLCM